MLVKVLLLWLLSHINSADIDQQTVSAPVVGPMPHAYLGACRFDMRNVPAIELHAC